MQRLRVNLSKDSYDISFNRDFSNLLHELEKIKAPKKIMIVTDTDVKEYYLDEVKSLLKGDAYDVDSFVFKAGEESKTIDTVLEIIKKMMQHKMDRNSMVIALGGGVVGDMAGFAAGIYMRSIRCVQIPTSLLAQSDSSVGGKNGVDFEGAKNFIGTFLQPKHVYINVGVLKTLPKREFVQAMAEVIKHAIIRDEEFFSWLYENKDDIMNLDTDCLLKMCNKNCQIKAKVVENDEKEKGERAHLNFGHTIGHAIESSTNFQKTHGECVGLGIVAASYIALERNMITKNEFESIENMLSEFSLDIKTDLPDTKKIIEIMKSDKKSKDGKLRFVLPDKIGNVGIFDDVTKEEISKSLSYIKR